MLLGDNVQRPDWARGAEVAFILEIGLVLMLLLPRIGARWTFLVGGAAVAPVVADSWYAYALTTPKILCRVAGIPHSARTSAYFKQRCPGTFQTAVRLVRNGCEIARRQLSGKKVEQAADLCR
jgi:hypothetical protein